MSPNIYPIRIETCANVWKQMQIFNFSLKADYTCKLVNTQNSIRYMHITEFRKLHLQRVATLCKKASNHHANLPLEMYSFTL